MVKVILWDIHGEREWICSNCLAELNKRVWKHDKRGLLDDLVTIKYCPVCGKELNWDEFEVRKGYYNGN